MTGLVNLVQHKSIPHLPLNVSDVLLLIHRSENIELWDPKDPMTAFWDISGQVSVWGGSGTLVSVWGTWGSGALLDK